MPDDVAPKGRSAPVPKPALPRGMCTDCGLSRIKLARECGHACQFTAPRYPELETEIHGAPRDVEISNQLFFGPNIGMHKAAMASPRADAQWTGITTSLGEQLLVMGKVDAVLTIGPDPGDRWKPRPVLITEPSEMQHARGMRMGFAPLLSLLEPAADAGYKRIAVIGIPCQIHALRGIEQKLGFDKIYVIGTPCSDNTTTENFRTFLGLLSDKPETVCYLEFRADYHVELRFEDGRKQEIPFLKLPLSDLPKDFFPLTCQTCVDYTNALADITVGYMAGQGEQWVIVRNERGQEILDTLGSAIRLSPVASKGKRDSAVKGFMENTKLAAGGLPLRRMPNFMRGIMGWLMPRIGPKGSEFARARVEMKAIETILHLRRARPNLIRHMVPDHVWKLVARYGLRPESGERPEKR